MRQNFLMLAALLTIASCSDDEVPDLPQPCGEFGYYDSETYYCYTELRQRCDSAGNCDVLYSTCYVSENPYNSAYYVMTCGTTTASWPKAMCDAVAYDPSTQICKDNRVITVVSRFTDVRDSIKYKAVDIGTQTWMAENLNYDIPDDDTDICYEEKPANCKTYGRLYDWNSIQGVCPSGWHIPSDAEWATLINFAGEGSKLKSASGWNGTNDYRFSALPGGWWSASEYGAFDLEKGSFKQDNPELLGIRCIKDKN